ncbi:Frizzled/Smoothened membrane region [Balamuthia mandrillaris]
MSRQTSSSSLFLAISVLVMLFCLHGSNAQLPTCYNSTIAPPQCLGDGMISFPQVFLTAEAQGATPESTYAQAYGFFNGLTAAPAECQKVGVEFLCGAFYGNCADFSVVCRDTCELFLQTCGPVFQSFGVELQGLPPCEMFMEDNCNTFDYQGTYPIKECPGELVHGDGGNCAPKCPTPYFSDEEQDAIDLLLGIGSFFSFFGALFIIITHILRWKEEKDTLVIWVAVSFCLMALNIMWGFLYGWQDMRCKDDITVNEYEPAGVVFGLGFIWIGLYCTIWWFNVCLNMAITLIFKKTTDKYRFKIMHIFTWIFPIIIAIISLAVEKVGCVFGLAICLYQADERDAGFQAPTLWYSFGLFWFPITLFFFAGVVLLIFVIIWIMRTSGWSGLVNQWRLLAFIIAIFLTFLPSGNCLRRHCQLRDVHRQYYGMDDLPAYVS